MDRQVEVHPKQWFKYFMYGCGILGFVMGAFNVYQMWNSPPAMSSIQNGDFAFIFVFIVSILFMIFMPFAIPHYYNLKIVFDSKGIRRHAFFTKYIPYEKIDKISVKNGLVEVRGDTLLNNISFGNLYTNFDSAVNFLAFQIENDTSITYKGNDKYRDMYFQI